MSTALSLDNIAGLTVADQRLGGTTTKRTGSSDDVRGLEQTGFATAITAIDHVVQ